MVSLAQNLKSIGETGPELGIKNCFLMGFFLLQISTPIKVYAEIVASYKVNYLGVSVQE